LDDGQVTRRKVAVELRDVGVVLDTVDAGQGVGVDARAAHEHESHVVDQRAGERHGVDHPAQQVAADARPTGYQPSGWRTWPGLPGYVRRAHGPGWALV